LALAVEVFVEALFDFLIKKAITEDITFCTQNGMPKKRFF